jgi:hypothetical protein
MFISQLSSTNITVAGFILAAVYIVYLWKQIRYWRNKHVDKEPKYVDTSGIMLNPPKFIDVLKNKTINFRLGKESIRIEQISASKGLSFIEKIAQMFQWLQREMQYTPNNKVDGLRHDVAKMQLYKLIVKELYKLSKPFAKNKRRFKKELMLKAKTDIEYILLIVEQVLDYWMYLGELVSLLARGGTLRQIIGVSAGWSCISTGTDGKISIKPRYAY